jgi:flagellar biosynthesis protein FlhF
MSKPDQMRIKSYFAKSVDDAMLQAREELGDDAMFLSSRKALPESGQAGYEVVFGVAHESPESFIEPRAAAGEWASAPSPDHFASELEQLHAQMDEIRSLIIRSSKAHLTVGRTVPELADVYACLMSSEVDAGLSKDIVDRLEASMATDAFFQKTGKGNQNAAGRWKALRNDLGRLEPFLRVELEHRVGIAPQLGEGGDAGVVAVLVGPPGAGKTTSLAKLAASKAALAAGRPLRVFSLDGFRATAHLQLKAAAKNLGFAFTEVPAAYLLPDLVAKARKKETVLIDTPGYTIADKAAAESVGAAFAQCPGIDVHLVVPAYMKPRDLRLCIQRYQLFRPSKLLVTKLDETQSLGSVFSEAARGRLRLSFLAHGPNDIRPASSEDLMALAAERPHAAAQRVA